MDVYPDSEQETGHGADILHPGLVYVNDFSENPDILTVDNSPLALSLSTLKKTEIVLPTLVPEHVIEIAITSTAQAIREEVADSKDHMFVPIMSGAQWYYDKLRAKNSNIMTDSNYDSIQIRRTKDKELIEPYFEKDFDEEKIKDKVVWIIDDLGDENLTTQLAVKRAWELGAKDVKVVILVNKLGAKNKAFLKEIAIVGIGVKGTFWIGGGGADYCEDFGRDSYAIGVMMQREEWEELQETKRKKRATLQS